MGFYISFYRKKKAAASKGADLKKKLDRVFSQYIRLRDMLPGTTLFRCISCGKVYPISNADCAITSTGSTWQRGFRK